MNITELLNGHACLFVINYPTLFMDQRSLWLKLQRKNFAGLSREQFSVIVKASESGKIIKF